MRMHGKPSPRDAALCPPNGVPPGSPVLTAKLNLNGDGGRPDRQRKVGSAVVAGLHVSLGHPC